MSQLKGDLIVIAGPTASGKTSLSFKLAKLFDAEIISADARQFYRGLDIGTAKPSKEELSAIPHHFIDILDPEQAYTAGQFETDVLAFLEGYFKRKQVAILVGGSGLYIKAITDGFDPLPATPTEVRSKYDAIYQKEGMVGLQGRLQQADPEYYTQVDIRNRQRVQRALEAVEVSGQPFSTLRNHTTVKRPFRLHKVLLSPERTHLYSRINQRVDEMIAQGLEAEVKRLIPHRSCNALQTVGYQEWFAHLDGSLSREEAIEKIKQHSRNYAKRQYTWFRKQSGYFETDAQKEDEVVRHLREQLNV